jgi:hypothetical protein
VRAEITNISIETAASHCDASTIHQKFCPIIYRSKYCFSGSSFHSSIIRISHTYSHEDILEQKHKHHSHIVASMSFFKFVQSQWTPLPVPTTSFAGQTIIVTGSNTGLGLEAARHFVRLGASKVILAVRSIPSGQAAAKSIHESTGKQGVCEVWHVNLGDWDTIKEFVKKVEGLKRLDVVVENAGVATREYSQMSGFERTVAVNVVGTFLMALLLLPVLRRKAVENGGTPKLAVVSSEVHARVCYGQLTCFDDLLMMCRQNSRSAWKILSLRLSTRMTPST